MGYGYCVAGEMMALESTRVDLGVCGRKQSCSCAVTEENGTLGALAGKRDSCSEVYLR